MNRRAIFFPLVLAAVLGLGGVPGRAGDLSPQKLDTLDQMGCFTPGFKAAVHDLINSKQALEQANAEKIKLTAQLPGLKQQATGEQAKEVALRQELANYDHPDDNDFVALQAKMNDATAKPEDQIALAQAYVWTYPASPHVAEAQRYLQQIEQKLAAQRKAIADAETAREIAHARLVLRAQAHALSLTEWRDFLRDMSEDELVKLLGRPTSSGTDNWVYAGEWTVDPVTQNKVGLEINFNAGRVQSVDEKPPQP
jgi:hypothetical protein